MWCIVELLNIKGVLFKLNDGALVVVDVAVVWSRENCNHCREFLCAVPFVHFVSVKLSFMGPQYREELVLLKKGISCLLSKEIRTASDIIRYELLRARTPIIIYRI